MICPVREGDGPVNDRVQDRPRGGGSTKSRQPGTDRAATKSRSPVREARREAVRQEAARRAAQRRRKRLTIGGILAVVAVALAVVLTVAIQGGSGSSKSAKPDSKAALATKPTVSAGTGDLTKLTVTPLIEGTGAPVASGQHLTVNYVGVSYKTGKEFDSSWSRSQPFAFTIGSGNGITGWDQGLIGVKVGSRVQLDIPSDLAYGDDAKGGDAPTGPLRFVVDVLKAE
jgi:peptidylprolyl isomerase